DLDEAGPRLLHAPELVDGLAVADHQSEALDALVGEEVDRTIEQIGGGMEIGTVCRTPARLAEMSGCARRERGFLPAELDAVAVGVRAVVAENLAVLADAPAGAALEPVGETLVQRGAEPLRRSAIRGVAHEDVLEPVGDEFIREARGGDSDHVLAREPVQAVG